jgi:CBS domain-containing membrane protein
MTAVLVKHIMSAPVVTFFAEQTLPLAEDVMRFKHIRHLPVVDEHHHLVGLVSHRDLLAAKISTLTGLEQNQRRARQDNVRISEIMTRNIWSVRPDTNAAIAGRTLLDHKYGCLPVIDGGDRLVGIVTERDYLRIAVHALEAHEGWAA